MTTTSASPALKRVCTVRPVLRFVRNTSINGIVKIAHVSDTFRDALENYSPAVWSTIASSLRDSSLAEFFKCDAFAWVAHNILTLGQLDSSVTTQLPLRIAAEHGAVNILRACLAAIPSCISSACDRYGNTALLVAVTHDHTDCARELLASGIDVTVADGGHWTALHHAAAKGRVGIVRLLAAHADIAKVRDARNDEGWTALHLACRYGHTECVRGLLGAAGAGITVANDGGETALHLAADRGHDDIVRMFVAHPDFARVRDSGNEWNSTALQLAADRGHAKCVDVLLASGADITIAGSNGGTALHYATLRGDVDSIRLLAAHADFAKIRDVRNREGRTAMDITKSYNGKKPLEVAKTKAIKKLLS